MGLFLCALACECFCLPTAGGSGPRRLHFLEPSVTLTLDSIFPSKCLGCDLKTLNRLVFCFLAVLAPALWGCGEQLKEIPAGEANIQEVARWYQDFRSANRRQYPPNEQAFATFIKNRSAQQGTPIDPQQLLTSPRDGQKYVVQYGTPKTLDFNKTVVAHEKEGVDGKKLVVFETKASREVDDAELKSLLAGK